MKNAKIFNILRYIFGVFLIIGGLGICRLLFRSDC